MRHEKLSDRMRMQEWLGCQVTVALLLEQRPGLLRNRLRDGRLRLPVDAWLATTRCQASGTMYFSRGTHPVCRLAGSLKVNQRKPTINPVTPPWRNALIRHAKRQAGRRCYFTVNISPFVAPPGNSGYLKETQNVDHPEHGKPVGPHAWNVRGIPDVRTGDGPAGMRRWRKRMLSCNRADRAVDKAGIPNAKACRLPPGLDEAIALSRRVTVTRCVVIRCVHDGFDDGYVTTRATSWTMHDAIELTGGLDDNPGRAIERAGSSDLGRETGRMDWLGCHRDSHFQVKGGQANTCGDIGMDVGWNVPRIGVPGRRQRQSAKGYAATRPGVLGSSRVHGNVHARFLGEEGLATAWTYPVHRRGLASSAPPGKHQIHGISPRVPGHGQHALAARDRVARERALRYPRDQRNAVQSPRLHAKWEGSRFDPRRLHDSVIIRGDD